MAELLKLKSKRTSMRSLTTRLINKIETNINIEDESSDELDLLEEYLEQIAEKTRLLQEYDSEIENLLEEKDISTEIESAQEYQEKLISIKCKIKSRIKRLMKIENVGVSQNTRELTPDGTDAFGPGSGRYAVKLPKLTIDKYFGDPSKWLSFWNQFQSAIHDNNLLNEIDKFNYLKSLLGGNALNSVSGFSLSKENYLQAISLLKERFGRSDVVINAHMNKLLNIEPVKSSMNIVALRKMYDDIEIQIRNLSSLNVTSGSYGNLLSSVLLKVVPDELALEFTRKQRDKGTFEIDELLLFIRNEVECREATVSLNENANYKNKNVPSNVTYVKKRNKYQNSTPTAAAFSVPLSFKCRFCSSEHKSHECENISVKEKRDILRKEGLCFLCFKSKHHSLFCKSKIRPCNNCNSRLTHNKSICYNLAKKSEEPEDSLPIAEAAITNTMNSFQSDSESKGTIYLQTCSVMINNTVISRLLIDNGSHRTFITSNLSKKLKLRPIRKESLLVYTFGQRSPLQKIYDVVRVELCNIKNPKQKIIVDALVTPYISETNLKSPCGNIRSFMIENNFQMADSHSTSDTKVEILIGCDHIVNTGKFIKLNSSLVLNETLFGFTVMGKYGKFSNTCSSNAVVFKLGVHFANEDINNCLKQFWKLESLGITDDNEQMSKKDLELVKGFEDNLKFIDNRYETGLIWRDNCDLESSNFDIAKRRFFNLSNKLRKNDWLMDNYRSVFSDQLDKNIIEECNDNTDCGYFMPHSAVIKPSSTSSPVRIVFDCSSSSTNNNSLNDCLLAGPNLNPSVLDIILNFRKHSVVFAGDLEKAFLNIRISESERNYLKFLWYKDDSNITDQRFKSMRMTSLPFGATCSPFILAATIKFHLRKYEEQYPDTCKMLNNSLYVDDLYYGIDSVEKAFKLSTEAIHIMKEAGMNLRKFQTNSELLNLLWIKNGVVQDIKPHESPLKVLGIIWDPNEDVFKLEMKSLIEGLKNPKNTKRFIIQTSAKIFDPVGFISPYVIRIKCLYQSLWQMGLDWDEELPEHLSVKWEQWYSELRHLENLSIPRWYFPGNLNSKSNYQIHIFSDSSVCGFGACAYIRYTNEEGQNNTSFIMSKSRVAPLKTLTLPRLELLGAVIGARLAKYLKGIFKISEENIFMWTDSIIVLSWIRGNPRDWKPFVSNRVVEIKELTDPQNWRHCKGKENPADLLTRGEKLQSLINNPLWWYGPHWLVKEINFNREISTPISDEIIADEQRMNPEKSLQFSCVVNSSPTPILEVEKFSSLSKLYRITAWVQRFIQNSKAGAEKETGTLTVHELKKAEVYWVKLTQNTSFEKEIKDLKCGNELDKNSKIYQLNPFLDENGQLRLKGRLQLSNCEIDEKHPIILKSKTKFAELLILNAHEKVFHFGVEATLTELRSRFWILKGRQFIKFVLKKCFICRRYNAQPGYQVTSPLPSFRITESPPFSVTGLDFFGPLFTKGSDSKFYGLIFSCAVTRAIHIEIVPNLTTESFMLGFRRFIARRGWCSIIISDNAKTFKRGDFEFKQMWGVLDHPQVKDFYASRAIEWKFNVEKAAWWGGIFERMIKSVKMCLRKAVGKTSLTQEQLETTLIEIEGVINSRPITFVHTHHEEPNPLTPAHFLLGERPSSLPAVRLPQQLNRDYIVRRFNYRQKLLNQFWKRWTKEYLLNLRSANCSSSSPGKPLTPFKVDDVVLIGGEPCPRNMWRLGRVQSVFPGRDGKIRSCMVKTMAGTIRRPIQLLYPLELN